MDAEVRRLERLAAQGEDVAEALARARAISGLDRLEKVSDPAWRARERREESERAEMLSEVEFCRRAVNDGIWNNLYRGRGCWCQVIMSLRELEGLPRFVARTAGGWNDNWHKFEAEFRLRDARGRRRGQTGEAR